MIAPVVVAEPIVFPVVVPMLTEPPSTLIPAKTPGAVAKALVVENEIAVTVFPWMPDAGETATVISIAR